MHARPLHEKWLKFLKTVDRQVPKDDTIHLILDNYATHSPTSAMRPTAESILAKVQRGRIALEKVS